jgi:hypothetical protein
MEYPTSYPDVNVTLDALQASAQAILGANFVGMYLYGSLASGDFDPERSDIDFVIVTKGLISNETIAGLEAMHTRTYASGLKWARKLEGAYIPQSDIRSYEPDHAPCPFLNEGRFYLAGLGSDWVIQRHVLREQGVTVAGPEIRRLIDPVRPTGLRQAVLAVLREWWAPILQNPALVRDGEYQAYAVLTMCRSLYTLEHGTISSKPVSARWAQAVLGEPEKDLIEWALSWNRVRPSDRKKETLEFIRLTLERSQEFTPTKDSELQETSEV